MTRPLGASAPVAGGIDLPLPGDGIRLAGTRWPGRGTAVLLLHGLASQRRFWNLVVPHLAGLPVVAVDQRGHGDSDRPASGYGFGDVVADLPPALDALGLDRVVVVGHSWGAGVAVHLAAANPERVLAVVAVDGGFVTPLRPGDDRDTLRTALQPPRLALPPDELRALLRGGPLAEVWTDELDAAVLPIFGVDDDGLARARLPFDRHMQVVDALIDDDPVTALAAVRCPTWLVSCDPVSTPADERAALWQQRKDEGLARAAEVLERPRLMRWAGAVHDVPLQWPALVAGLVRAAVADAAVERQAAGSG